MVKNLTASVGDVRETGLFPGWGRSLGEGKGNPLLYSCLDNSMDRGAWWTIVHRVAKSWTRLGVWAGKLPRWLSGKESTCQRRSRQRLGFDPWSGRFPGGGHGYPLQYSGLENPMDRGTWWVTVHEVAKSRA